MIYIKNVGERRSIIDRGGVRGNNGELINQQCIRPPQIVEASGKKEVTLNTFPPQESSPTIQQALVYLEKLQSSPDKVT